MSISFWGIVGITICVVLLFPLVPWIMRMSTGAITNLTNQGTGSGFRPFAWIAGAVATVVILVLVVPIYMLTSYWFWGLLLLVSAGTVAKLTKFEWAGSLVFGFGMLLFLVVLVSSGIGQWVTAKYDSLNRTASARSLEIDRGITVYKDFLVNVPVNGQSETIANDRGKCLRWTEPEGEGRAIPETQVQDRGTGWVVYPAVTAFSAVRWSGNGLSEPYKVRVQVRKAGQCGQW